MHTCPKYGAFYMGERIRVGNQELRPGDYLAFQGKSVPEFQESSYGGTIEDIRGGGFYGRAIVFHDFVVKTTQPDSWHLLWRRLNRIQSHGSVVFPPQESEHAAKLDHLSANIIHKLVPHATGGIVISPESYGYTIIDQLGFAQIMERLQGRGARFNAVVDENARFGAVRKKIWELGVAAGIEHAAQVHPNNPFGKPNLWTIDGDRFVWLDTLPAISHTGFVLPAFYFNFHNDVRRKIGNDELTFNRIHTDKLRVFIERNTQVIPDVIVQELFGHLHLYDEIWEMYKDELRDERQVFIGSALKNKIISVEHAIRLSSSDLEYYAFLTKMVVEPAVNAFIEFVESTPFSRVFRDQQFRQDIVRFIHEPQFRAEKIMENIALKGVKDAYLHGLISEYEYRQAWDILQSKSRNNNKLAATYLFLQTHYLVTGAIINSISIPVMASAIFAEDPLARLSLGLFIDWVVPSIVRASSTLVVALATQQNLTAAIVASSVPKAGSYIAIPADVAHRFGKQSEQIWHYTKRGIVASFSSILRPWGGWNSDLEERLWETLQAEKW